MRTETIMARLIFFILTLIFSSYCYGDMKNKIDSVKKEQEAKASKQTVPQQSGSSDNKESTKNWFDWNDIFQDTISNVIGGILFALLLFFANEYLFKTANISGEWTVKITTTQTTYNPFKNLSIEYRIHLLQLGSQVSGRGEKIKDINSDGSDFHVYPHVKRVEIEITGHYEKKYLKPSKLFLLVKENGTKRVTTASYDLTMPFFSKDKLEGKFVSTAANSRGDSTWIKLS